METVFKTALQESLHVLCTPPGSMRIALESSTKIKRHRLLLQLLPNRQLLPWQKDFSKRGTFPLLPLSFQDLPLQTRLNKIQAEKVAAQQILQGTVSTDQLLYTKIICNCQTWVFFYPTLSACPRCQSTTTVGNV